MTDTDREVTMTDLVAAHSAAAAAIRARGGNASDPIPNPPLYAGEPSREAPGDTPGAVFARSPALAGWLGRFRDGAPSSPGNFTSDPVGVGGFRALVTSADESAGALVTPEQIAGVFEPGLVRPLTVRQLLTVRTTTTDTIEYVREASRVSSAAPVAEATGLQAATTGTGVTSHTTSVGIGGLKPEGALTFERKQVVVRTFAEWIPATRRILSDAQALADYVNQFLRDDLALEVEEQILSGDGTGENFLGLLNDPDVTDSNPPGDGESLVHAIRRGIREVIVQGRTRPNGILLNPSDVETLDLLERNEEVNNFLSEPFSQLGQPRLFGIPIVETDGVPPTVAIVGDFTRAVLFDREDLTLTVGTVMDDFVRNIVRVLGELRVGFATIRPKAFARVSLVPGS